MPETTRERERFACARLGGEATLTRILIIRRKPTGEIEDQVTKELRCESARECGLAAHGFDRSRCVHPELGSGH